MDENCDLCFHPYRDHGPDGCTGTLGSMLRCRCTHKASHEASNKETGVVIRCPNCGGLGRMCDGSLSIGPGLRTVSTPASVCPMCDGQKAVFVRPATNDEACVAFTAAHILDVRFGGE